MYIKFMKFASVIIVLFLIIYLGTLVDWIFIPAFVFFQTLFVPIILALVLFYLFRPVVRLLSKKIPRVAAIIILYTGFTAILIGIISLIVPELQNQLQSLINSMPMIFKELQLVLIELQQHELIQKYELTDLLDWEDEVVQVGVIVNNFVRDFISNILGFAGALINVLILFFIVPFILFYLLKEGEKFPKNIIHFINENKQTDVRLIIRDLDTTLSQYIKGVLIVCSFIGVLCYIAYTIIGLDYALILALIAMLTNVIPYVGPWIGTAPAVIVGFIHSPFMALLVIIIVVIIQQIESIFIQPQVMGKQLSMHPVTVLILVLVAGRFAGLVGMLLAVPMYAVGKVVVTHSYRLWKLKLEEVKGQTSKN